MNLWNGIKQYYYEIKNNFKYLIKSRFSIDFFYITNDDLINPYVYEQPNNNYNEMREINNNHINNNLYDKNIYNFNNYSNNNINNNHNYINNYPHNNINNNHNYINNYPHNNINNNHININNNNPQNIINEFNYVNYIPPDKKHLRGLVNIESTCYMNSILQCFGNIKELAVYFQTEKMEKLVSENKNNNQKFFPVFQEVIKQLWDPRDNSAYSPYNFKKRLGDMNPLFKGAYPNDAKDLLTFILLQLHEELNKPKNNNNNNDMNIINNINMQIDKNAMFKTFCQYFINDNRSIISDLFYGIFYTETKCINGHISYNYQTFNFIIFPLEKVLNYKISSNNFMSNFNNTVTIEDCFNYYEFPTILNDYYCNSCKSQGNCQYISKFSIFPNIIIIILNRGQGLQYKVNISFLNENLGLSKFAEYPGNDSVYELIGLVTHYGDSSASGHFIARCKSPIDNEWYLYNDSIVQKIGYFNNESFAQGNPYILFYKKINFQ